MSLVRWKQSYDLPTFPSDVLSMQKEINRMFDKFFRSDVADGGSFFPAPWSPAADVAEHDDKYVVSVELPGVNKEDVNITMQDNVLVIRGEKKQEKETKESDYRRFERSYGSFQRTFALPISVKTENIDAAYKDGILTVTLPKAEEAKPRQIDVRVR